MLKINHPKLVLYLEKKQQLQELWRLQDQLISQKNLQTKFRATQQEILEKNKTELITFISKLTSFFNQLTKQNQSHPELIKKIDGDNWEEKINDLDLTDLEKIKTEYQQKFFDYLTDYYQKKEIPALEITDYLTQYNELVEKWNRTPQSQPTYWPLIIIVLVALFGLYLMGKCLIQPILKKRHQKATKH